MDGLDPRDGAFGPGAPKLPRNIDVRVSTWLRDYAQRVQPVTGRAPSPNPAIFIVDRRGMATALANVSNALLPAPPPGVGPMGDWLMRQVSKQMANFMSKDVLGLYVPEWQSGGKEPAMYVVAENVERVAADLGVSPEALAHYVTFHEATHQWQFSANPWLETHMAAAADNLTNVTKGLDAKEVLMRLVMSGGDIMSALPGLGDLQASMSLIEGYADFMTEQLGISRDPQLAKVAEALADRRAQRSAGASRTPMEEIVGRLTGMDAKRRQYTEGKKFCEAVHAAGGHALLNKIWTSPATLPRANEMGHPELWVARMRGGSSQAAA